MSDTSPQTGHFATGQMKPYYPWLAPWSYGNFASRRLRPEPGRGGTFASTYAVVVKEPGFGHSCA